MNIISQCHSKVSQCFRSVQNSPEISCKNQDQKAELNIKRNIKTYKRPTLTKKQSLRRKCFHQVQKKQSIYKVSNNTCNLKSAPLISNNFIVEKKQQFIPRIFNSNKKLVINQELRPNYNDRKKCFLKIRNQQNVKITFNYVNQKSKLPEKQNDKIEEIKRYKQSQISNLKQSTSPSQPQNNKKETSVKVNTFPIQKLRVPQILIQTPQNSFNKAFLIDEHLDVNVEKKSFSKNIDTSYLKDIGIAQSIPDDSEYQDSFSEVIERSHNHNDISDINFSPEISKDKILVNSNDLLFSSLRKQKHKVIRKETLTEST